jgi:hypothetical protein
MDTTKMYEYTLSPVLSVEQRLFMLDQQSHVVFIFWACCFLPI